ncbi:hypothetical protein [Aeromonas sp. HMWF014]|uniref:hypothetical protein n=1 Tax=Aeromonas sp. HMWF014 TaxID=2056850 RepID=UPI0011B1DC57|nr:hypothetical protein [Aeromonas sp. HMWF014]
MKKATYSILFSTLFFTTSSFAGQGLADACRKYTLLQNVTIQNYNYNTISSEFNIRTSKSTMNWYGVKADNNAGMLYDIAKTARLTGASVDVCVNTNGNFLLGLEWTKSVN